MGRKQLRLLWYAATPRIRLSLAAAVAASIAAAVLSGLAPLALKAMVDAVGSQNHRTGDVLRLAATYVSAIYLARLLVELRPLLAGVAEQQLYARLSRRYHRHLLGLPMQFHLEHPPNALATQLALATQGWQLLLTSISVGVVPVLIEAVTVGAVLVHLGQPALVGVLLLSAVAYLLAFRWGVTRIRASARTLGTSQVRSQALLSDNLLNVESLKCFVAEEPANKRYDAATAALAQGWKQLHQRRCALGLGIATIFGCALAASTWVTVNAVATGAMTAGGFVIAILYMVQLIRPMEALGAAFRDVGQALEFTRPVMLALDLAPEGPSDQRQTLDADARCVQERREDLPQRRAISIRLVNLHFGYRPGQQVLRGLDLEVPAGSTLGIAGASGSGKSSVARVLLRLHDAQSGRIEFDGQSALAIHPAVIRRLIAYVPQDIVLLDDSLAANVRLGRVGADTADVERAIRLACLGDMVERLAQGIDTRVGERGLRLSGGERQRVAIARALLKRSPVLLLDEATSMLDSGTERQLLQNLQHECAGSTTIVIAHRLGTLRQLDRIAVLQAGRTAEFGTHPALLAANGLYAALWRAQTCSAEAGAPPTPIPGQARHQ